MTYSLMSASGHERPNSSTGPAVQELSDTLSLERLAGDAVLDHLTWSAATALRDDRRWLEQQAAKADLVLSLIAESPHMLPSSDPRQVQAEHVLRELAQSLHTRAAAVRAASVALSARPDLEPLPSIGQHS